MNTAWMASVEYDHVRWPDTQPPPYAKRKQIDRKRTRAVTWTSKATFALPSHDASSIVPASAPVVP